MADSDHTELLKLLREESNELKRCFTRYSFQAVGIASAALGVVGQFVWNKPAAGLVALVATAVALTTKRIGTFKYGSSNRILGYQLYLERVKDVPEHLRGRWRPEYQQIGWEEALRAWRVVQATLFAKIYFTRKYRPNHHKPDFKDLKRPIWFRQQSMLARRDRPAATYYSGSYLREMMMLLDCLAAVSVFCLFVMAFRLRTQGSAFPFLGFDNMQAASALLLAFSIGAFVLNRYLVDSRRRDILEDGLLSIHSCAIVWQAVVVAHYAAVDKAKNTNISHHDMDRAHDYENKRVSLRERHADGSGLRSYTYWLAAEAQSLAANADRIHAWIGGNEGSTCV